MNCTHRDPGTEDFPCWHGSETAPHGIKILGFFEDIGWYPCAWSDMEDCWKVAYCHATLPFLECGDAELAKHDEPEWRQHSYPHTDLCWWMPFPPSGHPKRRDSDTPVCRCLAELESDRGNDTCTLCGKLFKSEREAAGTADEKPDGQAENKLLSDP